MYTEFFEENLADQAYESDQEALDEVRGFVDLCISLMFQGKNSGTERMDMRGVVITPQEFELALYDWTLENRRPKGQRRELFEQIQKEVGYAKKHIESRIAGSREQMPKLHAVAYKSKLSDLERFCFWLALVVEYDRKYERLYGYLQDNVSCRFPTLGLGLSLYQTTQGSLEETKVPFVPSDSPLFCMLLQNLPEEKGESRLSRPLCVRDEVLAFLQEEKSGNQEWENMGTDTEGIPGAARIRLVYGWEDLITDENQRQLLQQICDRIRFREKVMKEWGFEAKSPYGNGVSAIFYGSPGTGKTMAAQVIGKELDMEVWRVDLSQTVSKYIGETEKNMKQLFDAARKRNLILFFDEADSLFARRSEVSNSNDRYANMETGFLLQQFEQFEGVVILATNYMGNLDEAFRRRIKFYVRFPFPDREMRLRLWTHMLPEQAMLEEPFPFQTLANQFELPGSDIKEVITNAAFLAAAASRGIRREDVETAMKIHYLKMGRNVTGQELKIR